MFVYVTPNRTVMIQFGPELRKSGKVRKYFISITLNHPKHKLFFKSHAPTLKLRRKRKLIPSEGFSPGSLTQLLLPGN